MIGYLVDFLVLINLLLYFSLLLYYFVGFWAFEVHSIFFDFVIFFYTRLEQVASFLMFGRY